MRSIQTKISIVITVTVLATILVFMLTMVPAGRELLNDYSDRLLLVSARNYSETLKHSLGDDNGKDPDADSIRELVSTMYVYEDSDTFLLDENGDPVYHTRYQKGISLNDMPEEDREFIKRSLQLSEDEVHRKQLLPGNELGKVIIEKLDNGMIFGMSVPRKAIGKMQSGMRVRLIIATTILIVLSVSLGLLWIRSIIRPLKKMTVVADHYASGDFSEKMEVDSKDEIGRLSRNLQAMSESLKNQIERADEANKAKTTFLSNMSHEIRTPITAVLGFNEMILRESDDKDILMYAENIRSSGHTLLGLINDILDFSKIEAGKIKIIPVDYDMTSVINDLVVMNKIRAEEKGLDLILNIDRDIPRMLNGDEIRIKQIITNILTNAVKYTKKGSVTFSVAHEMIDAEPDNVMIKVSVKDTGIGIKEEDIKRLFMEFERIDEKNNRNIEGTGLGMNITQSLLGMMGSSLKVESVYGVGSVFSFEIKQKVVKWDPIGEYKASDNAGLGVREEHRSRFTAKDANILIVDDNATNLLVFKNLVKETLVQVDTASGCDECLGSCVKKKYDIIFLDHMMPGKDGIETLHELKSDTDSPNADTPVICLTANAVSGAREEYMREGFIDYLSKPIDPELLEEKMLEYLPKDKIDTKYEGAASSTRTFKSEDGFGILEDQEYIDVYAGIKHCVNNEVYFKILESFYEQIDDISDSMDQSLAENDIKDYVIKAHGVKSTSRTIGADALAQKAENLEKAGKEGDLEYIRQNHDEFKSDYMKIKDILKRVFA